MKKFILLISLLFIFPMLYAQNNALETARENYFRVNSDCDWLNLYHKVKDYSTENNILLAYKGATEIASASCIKGALNKLRYFKRGKNSLEEAVQDDPDNLEIRFLRYAVKINVPVFLNYNDYAVDENFIIQNMDAYIQQTNYSEISVNIANFMVEHGKLTEEEKKHIRNLLNKK